MAHLPAAEANGRLHLIAVLQEADDVVLLEVEVVLVDARPELHFFDDDDFLLLLGLALFLLLLKHIFPVVHDLADRRVRRRRDLYEIEVLFSCQILRLLDGNDSDLLAVLVDQADLGGADHVVNSGLGFCGSTVESRSSSWRKNT